jgi:hypothetical protein
MRFFNSVYTVKLAFNKQMLFLDFSLKSMFSTLTNLLKMNPAGCKIQIWPFFWLFNNKFDCSKILVCLLFLMNVFLLYFQLTVTGKGGLIGHPVMLNAEKESRPESANASSQLLEASNVKGIEWTSGSVKQRRNA